MYLHVSRLIYQYKAQLYRNLRNFKLRFDLILFYATKCNGKRVKCMFVQVCV